MAQINHRLPDGKKQRGKWSYRRIIKPLQQALLQQKSTPRGRHFRAKLFKLVNVQLACKSLFQACYFYLFSLWYFNVVVVQNKGNTHYMQP